jgi:hypothetical protein
MITTTAKSVGKYLSIVDRIRRDWGVQKHLELWFRAEDLQHRSTRLQPGLFRPRDGGLRKTTDTLLGIDNDLYNDFSRCATQLSAADANAINDDWDSYFLMQHHGCADSPPRLERRITDRSAFRNQQEARTLGRPTMSIRANFRTSDTIRRPTQSSSTNTSPRVRE